MKCNAIAITGANGFIGSELARYFAASGRSVLALQRSPSVPAGVSYARYSLAETFDAEQLKGIDCLVHSAVQVYSPRAKSADQINIAGSLRLLEQCRAKNIRFVFLSSMSAHAQALSHYGRHKFELEQKVVAGGGVVLKLGLVLGRAGLFNTIQKLIENMSWLPLIGGGNQPTQTVAVGDVCKAVEVACEKDISGLFHIAEPEFLPLKELYAYTALALGRKIKFLALPLTPLLWATKIGEALRLPLPLSSENILGLKALRSFESKSDLQRLGLQLKTYKQTIDELVVKTSGRS